MTGSSETEVRTSSGSYLVRVGEGVLEDLPDLLTRHCPAHQFALIADARVHGLHGERVAALAGRGGRRVTVHTFPAGEESKNRYEWGRLTDALLAEGLGRDGAVLALGGGVAGDLAGFVAATYLRGVPVVQIPTSVVAMVDSSVGGKTGVDVPSGKNLVGAFHPPRFVLADTELLVTLPRAERSQGLAEAVKHGAIRDARYFRRIVDRASDLLDGDTPEMTRLVARSVEIKAAVVTEDEREGGLRQILNFGHTLGHALEAESNYRLPHGSSVAIGMVLEGRLGEAMGVTRPGTVRELEGALRAVGLPVRTEGPVLPERVLPFLERDKKARGGGARFVLLTEIGTTDPAQGWSRPVELDSVRKVLETAGG